MSTPSSVPTASPTISSSTTSSTPSRAAPATLPEHLARWGTERGQSIALRHKTHGVWVTWTWGDFQVEVARIAAALADRGFERGDLIAVASGLSPQALAVTLAAQGLGGAALWVDLEAVGQPGAEASADGAAVAPSVPGARFGFARDEAGLVGLRARAGADHWALALFTAEHVSPQAEGDDEPSAVRAYAEVAANVVAVPRANPLRATLGAPAFFFLAGDVAFGEGSRSAAASLTQAASVAGARRWLEAVRAGGPAFAWEGPTTAAAAIFLAGWLVAGFTLTLPEDATTADADRREVQPTIVAATGTAYERLRQQVADNLPVPGGLLRRAVDAGLVSTLGGARGALGQWLVRRPLREVLGLKRVEVALVLGAPAPAAEELLARLGVRLRVLSAAPAEIGAPEAPLSRSAPDHAIRFEPALALSSSSPGELT